MAILLVNNYLLRPRERIRRYVRVLRALTRERVELVGFHEVRPGFEVGPDVEAIILSGSEACLSRPEDRPFFTGLASFLREVDLPVLGICFGHQLIAHAFGAPVVDMGRVVEGPEEVVVEEPDIIFSSWDRGDKILVAESHRDMVAQLPEGFELLAKSASCPIEAMRHALRPIYGVQFHPERKPEPWAGERWDGLDVLRRFLSIMAGHELK